jgi:serine/threonine protein kinase
VPLLGVAGGEGGARARLNPQTAVRSGADYMAPEVLNSAPYGQPADVWSLGVVLFELLTLSRPFKAGALEELAELVSKASRAAPLAPSRRAHGRRRRRRRASPLAAPVTHRHSAAPTRPQASPSIPVASRQEHVGYAAGTPLGATHHPLGLRRLASGSALLDKDPSSRMGLPELIEALDAGRDEGEDEDGVQGSDGVPSSSMGLDVPSRKNVIL